MALVRLSRSCLSMMYRKTSCDINKLPVQMVPRNFTLSQLKMDKSNKNLDQIPVHGLSKLALVVDGKYKSFKDVPHYLPYGVVSRARDKFRIKASIGSAIFITFLVIYLIRKNRRDRRMEEYGVLMEMEEAAKHK